MRHSKRKLQFNRFTSWRKATLKSLARSVLIYQSIKTTRSRALAVKPLIEQLITLAKADTLAARRKAFQILGDHALVVKLFSDIGKRFSSRNGGYLRIMHYGDRRGDNAQLVVLELTEIKKKEIKKVKKAKEERETKEEAVSSGEHKHDEPQIDQETPEKSKVVTAVPPREKKPAKKFFGGLRGIFKKERDSL